METKVNELIKKYGQNDQRSAAWHLKRGTMLTASEIWKGLPEATSAIRYELVMSKLTPRKETEGNGPRALIWGTRFESIAKEIYIKNQGDIQIIDTTCIPHPTVSFLGASPDGIIVTPDPCDFRYGKLVEFKCPISRIFSSETPIPDAYYHQMQLQMECTGMTECEYIEMGFKQVNYSEWMDSKAEIKGFFAVSYEDDSVVYRALNDTRDVPTWRREVLENSEMDNWSIVYWYLNAWRAKTVDHDKNWLSKNLESFQSIWNDVEHHRLNNTLPENPKAKTILTL